jgi:hypothetical protein
MLYLLPPDFDLPAGTLFRTLSTRNDLHFDSSGTGCSVIQTPDAIDGLEEVPPEQWGFLGFASQEDIDAYKTVDRDGNENWDVVPDKDAEFQDSLSALIADKYGSDSEKAIQVQNTFTASMESIGIKIKPIGIKPGPIRIGG